MAGKGSHVQPEKESDVMVDYRTSNMSSDWQVNGSNLMQTSVAIIPMGDSLVESCSCSSAPMADVFCAPNTNGQSLGSYGWTSRANFEGAMFGSSVAAMLPHFPADSGFIERASRFSCFSGGNFGEVMSTYNVLDSSNSRILGGRMQWPSEVFGINASKLQLGVEPQHCEPNMTEVYQEALLLGDWRSKGSTVKNNDRSLGFVHEEAERRGGILDNPYDEAEFSGHEKSKGTVGLSPDKGLGGNKRKRLRQTDEPDDINEAQPSIDMEKEIKPKDLQSGKPGGKHGKQVWKGSDPSKHAYIHVRAQRGQATSSHSLVERVRREKISQRMKFLQDLVPGCSKVTGKAVMLDEIINYVQSLQRQVEFLSMKLSTVNPRLDFNIEQYLAKDIPRTRGDLSYSPAFPPHITTHVSLLHPQPGPAQAGCPVTLQRQTNLQSTDARGRFNEVTSQALGVWKDELHSIVDRGVNSSAAPVINQDSSGSHPTKDKLQYSS